MASIHIRGKDRTADIEHWSICNKPGHGLQLKCSYRGMGKAEYALDECLISPVRTLGEMLLSKAGSSITKPIASATIYGERYAVVYYPGSDKAYIHKMDGITLSAPATLGESPVFRYFSTVAKARSQRAGGRDEISANIVRQLEKLPSRPETALQAYCTGRNRSLPPGQGLIYPFGLNESQLAAVENAFRKQVSVIEGPPGTGKTQTILNIVANILLRGQTVAVVSNTNSAVENVYTKLDNCGLGHLVARLGNQGKRNEFFDALPQRPAAEVGTAPSLEAIQATLAHVTRYLHDRNRSAQLQSELEELGIERNYLLQWQAGSGMSATLPLEKYGLTPRSTADLLAYLSHMGEQRIRLRDRVELLLKYRIFRAAPFATEEDRLTACCALQLHYYDLAMRERNAELEACHARLQGADFEGSLARLSDASMRHLKKHLHERPSPSNHFDARTYQDQFDDFIKRFPVLGSGTHSIVNSIAPGAVLDYVIIDEASLQDIVPGVLALGCAKNLVVVGDNRQLAHIPVVLGLPAPDPAYDCERYSLLDSCIAVFKDNLPRTLLKEHYRCHPRIIQFCNQQFYDNALVPMGKAAGDAPLRLVVTAKGNHARQNTNLRELESLGFSGDDEGGLAWDGPEGDKRGFISPFRAQVTLADSLLPGDFKNDTVHKFQGRECDEIIFSTVLDKKLYNQAQGRLDFVDDPRMINVAVSRAKHRFTLVTGDEVFTRNNGHVAALIRYVTYYAEKDQIVRAPVVSAFDLLYREYEQSLDQLKARLRPGDSRYRSEQIVAELLRQALSNPSCLALMSHREVRLDLLCAPDHPELTPGERRFMRRSRCDFVLYFKVGKLPVGVIEVDGGSHHRPDQQQRDALKNAILAKAGIPLLRLQTTQSHIEARIAEFVSQWSYGESEAGSPASPTRSLA